MTAISQIRPGRHMVNGHWVYDRASGADRGEDMYIESQIAQYMLNEPSTGPLGHLRKNGTPMEELRFNAVAKILMDPESVFDEYMTKYKFVQEGRSAGVVMKPNHTIVDRWPFAMKRQAGEPGAIHELQLLLGSFWYSYPQAWVRYVEWKRQETLANAEGVASETNRR